MCNFFCKWWKVVKAVVRGSLWGSGMRMAKYGYNVQYHLAAASVCPLFCGYSSTLLLLPWAGQSNPKLPNLIAAECRFSPETNAAYAHLPNSFGKTPSTDIILIGPRPILNVRFQ
uniref:Uncharacterized protein n=1 Tax=Eutreptiella gymnastica TaxID=73025 RepID=A0A7S4G6B4_9EUGL